MRFGGVLRVVGLVCGGVLFGCSALIGTRDLFYDEGAASGDGGGPGIDGGGTDGSNPGIDSGGNDGGVEASCGDTTSSPLNCGRCGHDCLGGGCEAGVCAPIRLTVSATAKPWNIAADGTNVYYTDIGGPTDTGVVYRMQKDGGGGPVQIATTTDNLVYDLKIDAQRAYFTSGSAGNGGAVEMVPLAGGAKVTIAQNAPGADDPRGLSIDAANVYWVNTDGNTHVQRAGMAAAQTPTTLAANEVNPTLTLVDGNILWWTSKSAGKLRRCTLPSCSDKYDLTTGLTEPDTLASNTSRVFYNSGNTIVQIRKSALLGPGSLVAANQSLPIAIAVDENEIYWINLGDYMKSFVDGDIRRCPVVNSAADCASTPNGEGQVVAKPGSSLARGLAIDPSAIYWTEEDTGSVWRLAR